MTAELAIAVAIPVYNEADGIAEFLGELDAVLDRAVPSHAFVVVDDCSTDDSVEVLERTAPTLVGRLEVIRANANAGHGPTTVRAYRAALGRGPAKVVQVDGDGQFEAEDLLLLLDAGTPVATGRRVDRADPPHRRALSGLLRVLLRVGFGVNRRDANCPFRAYEAAVLEDLLGGLPADPLVPHVLLSVLEERSGVATAEVPVRHRVRRGAATTGSTWRSGRPLGSVLRLARFCGRALSEVARFRSTL